MPKILPLVESIAVIRLVILSRNLKADGLHERLRRLAKVSRLDYRDALLYPDSVSTFSA